MVPFSTSASAIVKGMRSPLSPTLTMTKLPALRLLAISGASTSKRNTFSENCSLRIILFIIFKSTSNKQTSKQVISKFDAATHIALSTRHLFTRLLKIFRNSYRQASRNRNTARAPSARVCRQVSGCSPLLRPLYAAKQAPNR